MPIRYPFRKISEIREETRACFVGKVERNGDRFKISDGTGEISFSAETECSEGFKRIFCRREGEEWIAEVVQDLDGVDPNLFKKVEELYRREGLYV